MLAALCCGCGSSSGSDEPVLPTGGTDEFVNAGELSVNYSVVSNGITRADDGETLRGDFRICAWFYDRTGSDPVYGDGLPRLWEGTDVSNAGTAFQGDVVQKRSDGLWSTGDTYWWPDSNFNVDFYATYPTDAPNVTTATDNTNPTEPYTYKGVNLTVVRDNASVTDLQYSYLRTNKNDDAHVSNGTVSLSFSHALSQVSFYGITDNEGWHVAVQGISLHNVASSGTFDLKKGEWNAASLGNMTYYDLDMNGTSAIGFAYGDAATALTSIQLPRYVPGQTLTVWDTGNTIAANDASDGPKGSYLAVKCHIWLQGDSDIQELFATNANGSFRTIYIPFSPSTTSGSWEPGEHYRYTIHFGGGYDDKGKPNIINQLVTLTSEILPWSGGDTTAPEALPY